MAPGVCLCALRHTLNRNPARQKRWLGDLGKVGDRQTDEISLCLEWLVGHAVIALITAYFGSSAPVSRDKVVATAATNSVSARSPIFGHRSVIAWFGPTWLHFQKANPRKPASATKIAANIRYRKIFGRNGRCSFIQSQRNRLRCPHTAGRQSSHPSRR